MRLFKLSDTYTVVCKYGNTRNGFKHTATLLKNGYEVSKTKICYLNRTWEKYTFQSVLQKIIEKNFSAGEKEIYLAIIEEQGLNMDLKPLKTVSLIAKLGDVLCKEDRDKNKWKKKMLKTLKGVDFPEDFDNLPEKEQAKRLDNAINSLNKE